MSWFQYDLVLPQFHRGLHLITREVVQAAAELAKVKVGLLHVFIQHTSASLTINENADPDVPADLDRVLSHLAPDDFPYQHTIEGADDMSGHVKASLLSNSLTIPIHEGQLCLGTWQGIYLCEHRHHAGRRRLTLTIHGEMRS